jgi:hypothetical protein
MNPTRPDTINSGTTILHQVWVQGEPQLPSAFHANREVWKMVLPRDWRMILWDDECAARQWADYRELRHLCSHAAMRADLILARALRDFGGLITGTDCRPTRPAGLLHFVEHHASMLVYDYKKRALSSGLAWSALPGCPFFSAICVEQIRDPERLRSRSVAAVTGPGAWTRIHGSRKWEVNLVSSRRAFVREWYEDAGIRRPGWIDPGYAASWVRKRGGRHGIK